MLALAGAAVFALPVFAAFEFDALLELLAAEFDAFELAVLDVPFVLVTAVLLAADVFVFAVVFVLVLGAPLFAGAVSPQAMPREPNARTDESTRTFFITKISCLLQEVNLSKFNCLGSFARYFVNIGTNANVSD